MQVILTDEVKNLGKNGEEVKVADGFARNFLLPRGLAVLANSQNIKKRDFVQKRKKEKSDKIKNEAMELARQLEETVCLIEAKVGGDDRLFGSITTNVIANFYFKKGFKIDKKKVHLEQPIKNIGLHCATIKLHSEVAAQIKVEIVKGK